MMYGSWDIKHNRQSFLTIYPTKTQKTKILKTNKKQTNKQTNKQKNKTKNKTKKPQQKQQQKRLELSSSFYTSAPKNHNCYFLFWAFFTRLPRKIKIKKNWKKKIILGYHHFTQVNLNHDLMPNCSWDMV